MIRHWFTDCPSSSVTDEVVTNPRQVTCLACIERANR